MADPLEFTGDLTLSLSVEDLDKSITWYQSTLGFELIYREDEIGWCELKSPVDEVTIGLSQVEVVKPGGATPTFGVRNIESAKVYLEDAGVRIDGDVVSIPGMVKLLTFYDGDDNALMLAELDGNDN